jgi:hypothetical protein
VGPGELSNYLLAKVVHEKRHLHQREQEDTPIVQEEVLQHTVY